MKIEQIRKELDYIKTDMWSDAPDEVDNDDPIFEKSFILDEIDCLLARLQEYGLD